MNILNVTNTFLDESRYLSPVVLDNTGVELRADIMTNGSQELAGDFPPLFPDFTMMSSNHAVVEGTRDNTTNVPLLTERTRRGILPRSPRNPRE
jgi:hypothetical protein